jgi:hypothetical protein
MRTEARAERKLSPSSLAAPVEDLHDTKVCFFGQECDFHSHIANTIKEEATEANSVHHKKANGRKPFCLLDFPQCAPQRKSEKAKLIDV